MNLGSAFLAVALCVAASGCATELDSTSVVGSSNLTSSNAAPRAHQEARYRTGSRLPLRDDDAGASTVGAASKAAYEEEMRRVTTGSFGK